MTGMSGWGEAGLLDRCEHLRGDAAWVLRQWGDPAALLLAVDSAGLVSVGGAGLSLPDRHPSGAYDPEAHYLLGLTQGRPVFAEAGESQQAGGLRELMPVLPDAERELVVAAVALVNWHRTSPHCGRCGALTEVTAAGLVRHCPACGRDRFPRSDPAIIVAILDADDRLLLGHQAVWPTGRMSPRSLPPADGSNGLCWASPSGAEAKRPDRANYPGRSQLPACCCWLWAASACWPAV